MSRPVKEKDKLQGQNRCGMQMFFGKCKSNIRQAYKGCQGKITFCWCKGVWHADETCFGESAKVVEKVTMHKHLLL